MVPAAGVLALEAALCPGAADDALFPALELPDSGTELFSGAELLESDSEELLSSAELSGSLLLSSVVELSVPETMDVSASSLDVVLHPLRAIIAVAIMQKINGILFIFPTSSK